MPLSRDRDDVSLTNRTKMDCILQPVLRFPLMSVRQKLFVTLLLVALVPLLFLLLVVLERVESDLERRAAVELHKTLAKMGQEIHTLMETQKSLARGLAKVPVVRDFASLVENGEPRIYEKKVAELASFFLNYQSTVPSIQAIRFTDIEGRTLVKVKEGHIVPQRHGGPGGWPFVENISAKPFFRRAVEAERPISISDFERGKAEGEVDFCPAMIRYSVPLRDDLEIQQGFLIVNMWGKRVDDAIEAALGGYPGNAYLVEINDQVAERDGIYLYHRDPDHRFANQLGTGYNFVTEVGKPLWERIKSGGLTGMEATGDGERLLFYRKYAPYTDRNANWLLVIDVDRQTVLAPVEGLRHWIFVLIALFGVVSLAMAHLAASGLSRPVRELAGIITRYANGDKQVRYPGQRRDEIGSVGSAFNYMAEKLEEAEKERDRAQQAACQSERLAAAGQLAAGIAHEINNPLMNIMSLAALVEENLGDADHQIRADLSAIQQEGRRCARIVQGVLNFARSTEPECRPIPLEELIRETLVLFRHRLDSALLNVELDLESPLVVMGDRGQLQQVLVNLLVNAIQASPPQSTIRIEAYREGEWAVVRLLDEGEGVPPELLSKVFNPFFSTKPEGSGTGLGLSVSYGIVRQHGGEIRLENRSPHGVEVTISLPVVAGEVEKGSEEEDDARIAGQTR